MMIKKIVVSVVGIAMSVGLVASDAWADHPSAPAVAIAWSGSNFTANGSLGAAHNTFNPDEIGCYVTAYGDALATPRNDSWEGQCWAVKSDGTTALCTFDGLVSTVIGFVTTIGTINGSSFLQIKGANNGLCTEITVDNNSKYVAKNTFVKAGMDEYVSVTDSSATGALGSARGSYGDTTQYLGCQVSTDTLNGNPQSLYCEAQDADRNFTSCTTTRAHYITLMSMMKSDSYIEFNPDECTRVEVEFSSTWRPSF